jgi:hypothetical protein
MNRALAGLPELRLRPPAPQPHRRRGRCPKCCGPLTETTLTEARRLALKRRGVSRLSDRAAKLG